MCYKIIAAKSLWRFCQFVSEGHFSSQPDCFISWSSVSVSYTYNYFEKLGRFQFAVMKIMGGWPGLTLFPAISELKPESFGGSLTNVAFFEEYSAPSLSPLPNWKTTCSQNSGHACYQYCYHHIHLMIQNCDVVLHFQSRVKIEQQKTRKNYKYSAFSPSLSLCLSLSLSLYICPTYI